MTDKPDKKAESINAAKNLNRHLSDVFAELDKKDRILALCSGDLNRVAQQLGDIRVEVWVGNSKEITFLKTYLQKIADNLNGARS